MRVCIAGAGELPVVKESERGVLPARFIQQHG